ncbi:MAG: dipeptide epimerase [Cyclobacteriaceae bacterium]|nr:MAG: dipeptide epimerase [Cyclobacteriaceae bacterium]
MPKIKSIQVSRIDLELTRPYIIAFKQVNKVENAVVTIQLDNGITGRGAGNPSEQVIGENLSNTMRSLGEAVEGNDRWQGLIGRDIADLEILCKEIQYQLGASPTARTALEIALFDCYGLWKNQPLVKLLGQKIDRLPTSITIGIMSVEETISEAEEYVERGFNYIKVKLGNDLEQDIERVAKLQERFKSSVKLRVDANQGYNLEETREFYSQTLAYNLELIEQPLPADSIEEMRSLPKDMRRVLAADESLISPADADRLIGNDPACGIFNIKLMKCGGISQAQEISKIADSNDIDLMWGCNDESIISISAALHVALSCKHTRYLDLDGSLDLASDVVSGGFTIENGVMMVNDRPGLGLSELLD